MRKQRWIQVCTVSPTYLFVFERASFLSALHSAFVLSARALTLSLTLRCCRAGAYWLFVGFSSSSGLGFDRRLINVDVFLD